MEKKTKIVMRRIVPGTPVNPVMTCTLHLEVDTTDQAAVRRLARVLRELIPEDERAQFLADFQAAARKAGIEVPH